MLQVTLIGNLGGNAEVKVADGREFVTFRVAHNESYTGNDGQKVDKVQWIDCTMNCTNGRPAVLPYLVAGTLVCVIGTMSTRVYSSEKDRCWKAGVTIHIQKIELLGGAGDAIPRRLYDSDGAMVDVVKYYHANTKENTLRDQRGREYLVDANGWVSPMPEEKQPATPQVPQQQVQDNTNANTQNNGAAPF